MSPVYNSETLSNKPNPGSGTIGYCRAAAGNDKASEVYSQGNLKLQLVLRIVSQNLYLKKTKISANQSKIKALCKSL